MALDELFVKPSRLRAVDDVRMEREAQRLEFGPQNDDALLPAEWIARLTKHTGRAVSMNPVEFRQQMVVVGALALAAIESFDRKYGERDA